jgi:hypothetical protein
MVKVEVDIMKKKMKNKVFDNLNDDDVVACS